MRQVTSFFFYEEHLDLDWKTISILVKTFFFFWMTPQFRQKPRLIYYTKRNASSHILGKSLVHPQIILSFYAHAINACKTKAMVIFPKIKKSVFDYSIKCGESLISVKQNVKYIAQNIDDELNFKKRIKIVERKVACVLDNLAKSKLYLSRDICYCNFIIP